LPETEPREEASVNIKRRTIDNVTVVALSGALDGPAAVAAREKINKLLPQHEHLVVDLSETTCVSSASVRTMLLIYRQAQALGHTVAVVGLTPEVHNVLEATGFLDFFVVADTVKACVAAVSTRAESSRAEPSRVVPSQAGEERDREHALSGS
jgi:anti-anti-sigma factor